MSILHSAIQHADCHEPRHITTSATTDAGKVITPSSSVAGTSVLRQLAVAELSDGAGVATLTGTQTLTNKRVTPRVSLVGFSANLDVNADNFDVLACDSLTNNVTINAPTGTPTDGQVLVVRLTQDGAGARTMTWNAAFITTGADTTTASTTTTREFRWHAARAKWIQVAYTTGI